jgi:hypothetical protein
MEIDQRVQQLLGYGNGDCRRGGGIQRGTKETESGREQQRALLLTLQKIQRELRLITRRMTEADREGEQSSNWVNMGRELAGNIMNGSIFCLNNFINFYIN